MIDWQLYRDKDGYTTDKPNGKQTGNGILWTALEVYARYPVGIPAVERDRCTALMLRLRHKDQAGVIMRTPDNKFGQESHDNLYGIGYLSVRCHQSLLPTQWLRLRWYVMNNVHPGKITAKAWFGRMPHLVAHMKLAAGIKPNWFERFAWRVAQRSALKSYGKNVEAAVHFTMRNEVAIKSRSDALRKDAFKFAAGFKILGGLRPVLEKWGSHWRVHPIVQEL